MLPSSVYFFSLSMGDLFTLSGFRNGARCTLTTWFRLQDTRQIHSASLLYLHSKSCKWVLHSRVFVPHFLSSNLQKFHCVGKWHNSDEHAGPSCPEESLQCSTCCCFGRCFIAFCIKENVVWIYCRFLLYCHAGDSIVEIRNYIEIKQKSSKILF